MFLTQSPVIFLKMVKLAQNDLKTIPNSAWLELDNPACFQLSDML